MNTLHLVLASSSPRRKELLHKITDDFSVAEPCCCEISVGEPQFVAQNNAVAKGRAVSADFVVACDTIVFSGGIIFGKPSDKSDAVAMLKSLRGKTHSVLSAVYVRFFSDETVFSDVSSVTMKPLSDEEIVSYVNKFLPLDKAGSYGIQDGVAVLSYSGSFDNIVGLPTEKLREVLRKYIYVKEECDY